ncbi:unnamed protein product [Caenorhabditis brenneri]
MRKKNSNPRKSTGEEPVMETDTLANDIKEILKKLGASDVEFSSEAQEAVQCAVEDLSEKILRAASICAAANGRTDLEPGDIEMVKRRYFELFNYN